MFFEEKLHRGIGGRNSLFRSPIIDLFLDKRSQDPTWADGVDGDVGRSGFEGNSFSETDKAMFCGDVS